MTHQLNRGDKVFIMNGYQCYLKRTAKVIPMELKASQLMGYNLGIKLIRGAYMNEERMIAAQEKVESPVWDTIEATHKCYDQNLQLLIPNMKATDMMLVGSHNVESCEKAA